MTLFETEESYQMIASFTAAHMRDAYGNYNEKPLVFYGNGINISYFYDKTYDCVCVWSYYVVFKISENQ